MTGVLLEWYDAGLYLFMAALLLVFMWPRVAAATGVLAGFLCIPVFFYNVFPGVFRRLFPGQYKISLLSSFSPDKWAVLAMLAIVSVSFLNIRSLLLGLNPGSRATQV
jgi:hypothetical protein